MTWRKLWPTWALSSTRATPDPVSPSATQAARWRRHRLHQDDDPAAGVHGQHRFCGGGHRHYERAVCHCQGAHREIGILKALGCSRKDILLEFLAEANHDQRLRRGNRRHRQLAVDARCWKSSVSGWKAASWASCWPLVFAMVTGTVFGFYPAKQAASLIPIEALSEE